MFQFLANSRNILNIIDIFLVLLLLYQLFKLMRGTKGIFFLNAVVIIFLISSVSHYLKLELFTSLLQQLMWILTVAIPIIFQNELKQALETLGQKNPMIRWFVKRSVIAAETIDVVAEAAESLSRLGIGALVVFEREAPLLAVIDSGSRIDSVLSKILIEQIFYPNSPLHDGAVIIKGNRIQAAGCFLPLDNQLVLPQQLGSRHRAGLTLSSQTDALVVIVSEETGSISLAYNGFLESGYSREQLKTQLKEIIAPDPLNTKPVNTKTEAI